MALYKGDKLLAGSISGSDGKSAYEQAVAGGYQKSEEEFNTFLANAESELDNKAPELHTHEGLTSSYTATIGTDWAEDEKTGAKTQTIFISEITSEDTAKVDHYYDGDGTSDSYASFVEEENQYLTYITNGFAETVDGGIKFTIFGDANTVAIPIVVEVV